LVETRKGILSKAKLALRPMTILTSLTRRQGSSINVPLRGTPLTPLRLAELEVCLGPHKTTLDNADDVIHRTLTQSIGTDELDLVAGIVLVAGRRRLMSRAITTAVRTFPKSLAFARLDCQ